MKCSEMPLAFKKGIIEHPYASLWLALVIVAGAFLAILLMGIASFPDSHSQALAGEISSQILCGLFTLKALYVWPGRHLALQRHILYYRCSSAPHPVAEVPLKIRLPEIGKSEFPNPNHAFWFLFFLNLNVWAQWVVCGFMWGMQSPDLVTPPTPGRPIAGVIVPLVISFLSEPVAGFIFAKKAKLITRLDSQVSSVQIPKPSLDENMNSMSINVNADNNSSLLLK